MPQVESQRLQVVYWPIEKLIPFARNPRTHSEEQINQIAASIREFSWTNPVLIDPDGVIIAGHASPSCQVLNDRVPIVSGLSEEQRRGWSLRTTSWRERW
jgi:hypothetical protein